jgi:hypothetical protein
MPAVNVDLGVAEAIRVVDEILSRRRKRRESLVKDLVDDVEAAGEIVNKLDNLFLNLVRGFMDGDVAADASRLKAHVAEARKYLSNRELLPRLEALRGSIEAASSGPVLAKSPYRPLALELRRLVGLLADYRQALGRGAITGVSQTADCNLETLCEKALQYDYGGGRSELSLEQMGEQVLRNFDADRSDRVHRLVGSVRATAKAAEP